MKELRYLNKYFLKYRTKLLLGFLITVIARIFSLVAPRLIGNSLTAVENYFRIKKFGDLQAIIKANPFNQYSNHNVGTTLSFRVSDTFLMRQTIINVSRYVEFDLEKRDFLALSKVDATIL